MVPDAPDIDCLDDVYEYGCCSCAVVTVSPSPPGVMVSSIPPPPPAPDALPFRDREKYDDPPSPNGVDLPDLDVGVFLPDLC